MLEMLQSLAEVEKWTLAYAAVVGGSETEVHIHFLHAAP